MIDVIVLNNVQVKNAILIKIGKINNSYDDIYVLWSKINT